MNGMFHKKVIYTMLHSLLHKVLDSPSLTLTFLQVSVLEWEMEETRLQISPT